MVACSVTLSASPCGGVQVRPLNVDGSLNLLGLETVRLIYFRNKTAGKGSADAAVFCIPMRGHFVLLHVDGLSMVGLAEKTLTSMS